MKKLPPLLCLSFICGFVASAQNKQLHFDHIGTFQGISQSNILCLLQDSKGIMWFGSREGLNKYDGYKITVYKNNAADSSSISNNYINGMANSKNGDMWIATEGGGLCRFNRKRENFIRFQHDRLNPASIANNVVNAVLEDEDGMVWVGTASGLDKLNPAKNSFEHFTNVSKNAHSLGDNFIKYLFMDANHNLWIGTQSGGLCLYNTVTKNFTRFQHVNGDSTSINSNDIYGVFEDSKKRVWVGTNGMGLDLFNPAGGTFRHFMHRENDKNSLAGNIVLAINEDAGNNLWVSCENNGLSVFNFDSGTFLSYRNDDIDKESVSNNTTYAIYRDNKDNMWLGNFSGGVDLLNRDKLLFTHYKHSLQINSLSNNLVLSLMEDSRKNIWIGTDGGGLNLFDPATGSFKNFRHKKNDDNSIIGDNVLTTCEDSEGNIWIGTWFYGITVFNPVKNTYRHFKSDMESASGLSNGNAWKIFEDKQKNIWVGTFGGGLNLLNKDGKTFTHYSLKDNTGDGISGDNIVNIFEDSDGGFWLCTDGGGLVLFDRKTTAFTLFKHDDYANSISNNNVNSIYEDENKILWITTMNGLDRFDKKTHQFKLFSEANGFPGDYTYGILPDDNKNLWISSNAGISCFNPLSGKITNFGENNGLQSKEFKQLAYCKSVTGKMYFGGVNGFNEFVPSAIKITPYEPPLVLTDFEIFNQHTPVKINGDVNVSPKDASNIRSITLPYYNSVFSFEFASLNYTGMKAKKYAYMLENFDDGWNYIGTNRTATYTNLNPGHYVFKVKGFNNEGQWSNNVLEIKLEITPPIWKTWWFEVVGFLVISGSIIAFYKIRTRVVRQQQIKLKKLVAEQTQQLLLSTMEEQLARKAAEIANNELTIKNKELEQFAYVASHDLQEPLRTTAGFAELLQKQYKSKLDEKGEKYLQYITDASERMRVLIKDLLDFSRIGNDARFEAVDCDKILDNVLADISVAREEVKACIQRAKLPVIQGYPTEIKLLFQNLLINAIKFQQTGVSPQIKITVKKAGAYWQFCISDNGIGIDKQYQERIFNIFQRLHTRNEYTGSGIGLSHCKKIVELHKGKIWVESALGEGSNFYFLLPSTEELYGRKHGY